MSLKREIMSLKRESREKETIIKYEFNYTNVNIIFNSKF